MVHSLDFFRHKTYILMAQGAQLVDISAKADVVALVDGRGIVHLRGSWTVADQSFPAGALVQLDLAAVEAEPPGCNLEHDGEDLRDRPFLERKAALAHLLRDAKAGILLNEHIAGDGPTVFGQACQLGGGHRVEEGR